MAVVQVRLARILPNPLLAGGQPVPVAYCTGQGQGIASCREESDLELEYGTLIQCWGYGMVAGTFECWSGEKSPDEE